jgi:hypothetical protein
VIFSNLFADLRDSARLTIRDFNTAESVLVGNQIPQCLQWCQCNKSHDFRLFSFPILRLPRVSMRSISFDKFLQQYSDIILSEQTSCFSCEHQAISVCRACDLPIKPWKSELNRRTRANFWRPALCALHRTANSRRRRSSSGRNSVKTVPRPRGAPSVRFAEFPCLVT